MLRELPVAQAPRWVAAEDIKQSVGMLAGADKKRKHWATDPYTRDFVFRLNSGLLYSRKDLFRFGLLSSPSCPGCGREEQTLKHYFWQCPRTIQVVQELCRELRTAPAKLDPGHAHYIPHLSLKLLHLIYVNNFTSDPLCSVVLLNKFKAWMRTEKAINEKKGTLLLFLQRWEPFLDA
jgi:hypothetical protein